MKINFVGPSYVYPTINFDLQRSINLYPASSESGNSKDSYILCPVPGKKTFITLPIQPIRGLHATKDRFFCVAYNKFFEIFADGTYLERGALTSSFVGNVSIADNGLEICIVDGTSTGGYILNLDTNVFTKITAAGFLGGVNVVFISGYFLVNRPKSGAYNISGIYDGLSWNALDYAVAEGSPDDLVAVVSLHQQVYLLGSSSTEVIYNSGNSNFPFENVQGVFIEYGCAAPFTAEQCANTLFWVGNDKSGSNVVWMAEGYAPQRISTTAIENFLNKYDISQAVTHSYQEQGHYFYAISIPDAPTTIFYDITEKQWHERAVWNTASGSYERDRALHHVFIFGKHFVSDFQDAYIYEQSLSIEGDRGEPVRYERTLPYVTDGTNLDYIYFQTFQVDVNSSPQTSSTDTSDPKITLSFSNDNGHTWSSEIAVSMGKIGEFSKRCRWNRLGRARQRVYRLAAFSIPPIYLISCYQKASVGNA